MNDENDMDVNNQFDLLDCLNRPLLKELYINIKNLIRNYLTQEERAELKQEIMSSNSWISEFSPPVTACLCCNTAIYPMGCGG